MSSLRLGTRGSPLALWQARHVAARLEREHAGLTVELVVIKTQGDQRTDVPLGAVGGKGVFVREIEDALLDRSIDFAVHSLKDMPTEQPGGLVLTAFLERHDPRDALLSTEGWEFAELPPSTLVATGSPRRRSQLRHARPDLGMTLVRGNVDTRVRKLKEGRFGAMVLAVAGMERLGITEVPLRPIPVSVSLPAVGQGAIAVETRIDDAPTRRAIEVLDHPPTATCTAAERAFLRRLGGGCLAPATAHAVLDGGRIRVEAMVGDPDGRRLLREGAEGLATDGESIGELLAERLLARGADSILRDARADAAGSEG